MQEAVEGGGSKVLHGVRADPYAGKSFRPAELGNKIAAETKIGVGGSRTVYRSSTQGQHGAVASGNPRAPGGLFPGWGKR